MTTGAAWLRVRELFEALVDQESAIAQAELDRLQPADPDVVAEVRSLLAHHSHAGHFMETPAAALDPAAFDDAPLRVGETVGTYRVERAIGQGGMGRVFLATDTRLNRRVALKLLPAAVAGHPGQRERLRREARAAALLTHPGICTVYALEEIDGRLLIASEFVDGRTLRDELSQSGPMESGRLQKAAVELSEALAAAHLAGVTHRDFKPENIIRAADGRLKVLDFGLAVVSSDEPPTGQRLTADGAIVGTPAYMSPEQLKGETADARSDVFALGVVLYELATGAHPFEAATPLATAARVLESVPRPLAEVRSELPSRLIAAIERSLARRAADRFSDAAQFRAALDGAGFEHAAETNVTRWWRRHQLAAITLYLIAVLAAWQVKEWVPGPARMLFVLTGIMAIVGGVFRGHLLFTEQMNRASFDAERRRADAGTLATDILIGASTLGAGLLANARHEVWSLLIMGLGVGVILARLLVERATARGAFGASS